jgi:hypothetical protein
MRKTLRQVAVAFAVLVTMPVHAIINPCTTPPSPSLVFSPGGPGPTGVVYANLNWSVDVLLTVIIIVVIAAAAIHASGRRVFGCWLLPISSALLCVGVLLDLSRGVQQLGRGAIESDHKQLAFCLALLALSVLAAFLPKRPWLFWIAWTANAFVCVILVNIVFFWKVFS